MRWPSFRSAAIAWSLRVDVIFVSFAYRGSHCSAISCRDAIDSRAPKVAKVELKISSEGIAGFGLDRIDEAREHFTLSLVLTTFYQ